jgi:hypothetical protein
MEKTTPRCNYPGLRILSKEECNQISGGAEPAEGSYSLGYAIGSWFNEMYQIWSYGLTHLDER